MILVIPMHSPRRTPSQVKPPPRARKVAISLPAELLERVEDRRRSTGDTRSRLVGKALERYLRDEDGASLVREYVEGYRRTPESVEEVAEAESMIGEALAEDPWE